MNDAIDRFLASSVRCAVRGEMPPSWPEDWPGDEAFHAAVSGWVRFHGVALALMGVPDALDDWPASVAAAVREEARGQSFWEMGHRVVAARLIAALAAMGAPAVLTKGTALAYSIYPDPAARRRGDSDLLLGEVDRKATRAALAASGFRPVGDARPLQEGWETKCEMGFVHQFDLHWRINASALIAQRLERGGLGTRTLPLPRLCETACAIAPTDNIILIAINRALHNKYGYRIGDHLAFEQGRLIWALDIHLLCSGFIRSDWDALLDATAASGTAPLVRSILALAQETLGTAVPEDVYASLACQPSDPELMAYLGAMSVMTRLRLDLAASPTLGAKLRLVGYTLFPATEVLHERFPDATHWPVQALQLRRLVAGVGKLLLQRRS